MAKIPRSARVKAPVYREPWCLTWLRLTCGFQARKTMRMCQADKYNLHFMEAQIKTVENLALDRNRRIHEKNLMNIARNRGLQQACLEDCQAMQVQVYESLRKIRKDLEALEKE